MTIHKAQGLTLDRIEVDGDNIFSAGQLGVAIGRTTKKKKPSPPKLSSKVCAKA